MQIEDAVSLKDIGVKARRLHVNRAQQINSICKKFPLFLHCFQPLSDTTFFLINYDLNAKNLN